jgi:chromosome segregation ATPase
MGFNIQQYELAYGKNNTTDNSFSNATGDLTDLENQLESLNEKRNNLSIERSAIQREYDRFNAMNPCNLCKKEKKTKEDGKKLYALKLDEWENTNDKNKYAISTLEKKIEKAKIEEAKKSGTYVDPATVVVAEAPKSKTVMYIGIGVGVIAVGAIAFLLITKK